MIKAVIFDLGGVILKHKAALVGYILSQIFSISEEEGNKFWDEDRVKLLTGRLSFNSFLKRIKDELGTNVALAELIKKEQQLYQANAEIDWEVLDFATQLKSKYKVYLLTDTIDIHDEYNKNRKIYDRFDQVFKSHEEKISKAEGKQIFLNILKKINLKPEDCIFIDDLKEYVEAAQETGIKGIIFKNLTDLKEQLSREVDF